MKYIYKDGDKVIEVAPERWAWGVVYEDGTELSQFEVTVVDGKVTGGVFHRVGEIDQDRVAMAVLYNFEHPEKRIDIPWKKGMKLIHKYRTIVIDYMSENKRSVKVYIFGYKDGANYSYMFILPDDRIVFSPDENHDVTLHRI